MEYEHEIEANGDRYNTNHGLATFFGVRLWEFFQFWNALTLEEMRYYRTAVLEESKKANRIGDIARFFGMFHLEPDAGGWIGIDEDFWIFWESLTEEEMFYYEHADLGEKL